MLFLGNLAWAVPPTISPSNPVVYVGSSTQFTSGDSVNWSLSPGSTGTITAGGLYTAPKSITPKNVIGGCPLLPNDHIINTRIDNLPVDANSATRISNMVATKVTFYQSFPYNFYTNATPTTNLISFYTNNNDGNYPLFSFPYRGQENGSQYNSPSGNDHHILGVNTDTCQFSELYQFFPIGSNSGCPTCNTVSDVKYSGMSYNLPDTGGGSGGATDAAGMFIQPLALRYSELKAGSIKHALRFTLNNGNIYSDFVWPAVANAFPGCTPLANCVPYGARFRLKASYQIPASDSTYTKTIKTALKQYGMFMNDGGLAMQIITMQDVFDDTGTWYNIRNETNISTMSQTDFEQVDESSLMESTFSGHVKLTNAYVVPDNYANVIATRISDSVTSTVTVAIQPVTVGTKNPAFPNNAPAYFFMAGTPAYQLPYWVNGATTTSVTCTMSPTLGTLTSGCLYTAPATQTLLSSSTVTITPSGSDPSQAITVGLTVFPSDGVRINVGGKSLAAGIPYDSAGNYGPDALGKYWWSDPPAMASEINQIDAYYPQGNWPATTDIGLFFTGITSIADVGWGVMVATGAYVLTLGFGTDTAFGAANSTMTVDSQSTLLITSAPVIISSFTPYTSVFPIQVTTNPFYLALREINNAGFTHLSKWSLLPFVATNSQVYQGNRKAQGKVTLQ